MFFLNTIKNIKDKNIFLLFSILPIALIIGSAVLNSLILLINIFFIYEIYRSKKFDFFNNKFFFILLFIWIFQLFNSIIIASNIDSFIRSFGFLRFLLLIFSIKFYFDRDENFKNLVLGFWFVIFSIVTVDILKEFFTGTNILSFKSNYNGRIASFTGSELKIGGYYFGFILLSLSFFYVNFYKKYQSIFFILIFVFMITSFFIGERSNFIKVFFICSFFIIFVTKQNLIKKLLTLTFFISICLLTIVNNQFFKSRLVTEIIVPIKQMGISAFINNSRYGKHYEIAKNIYLDNKIFGVGIKNYRNASIYPEYNENDNLEGSSTHPHQIHYEFLSETGTIGYFVFITFFIYSVILGFKNFHKNRNPYMLSASLFLIATAIPLIPSGSFFTSYGASIFWINFSFLTLNDK